jgi:DNA-binding NarL/FixJ family response regulator
MSMRPRILLVDDHPIFRAGLVRIIEEDGSFSIIGQAGDGEAALELVSSLHPDLVLLDISLPLMDGLEVARRISALALPTGVVVLTMYKDARYLTAALDLGVRGYMLKDDIASELISCLKAVARGGHYISPAISHLLIERNRKGGGGRPSGINDLTPAERGILRLLADNRTSKDIAATLFVSERTVENHRMNICHKLGIRGHNKLLQFAIENKQNL